jgi:hypothetical protein
MRSSWSSARPLVVALVLAFAFTFAAAGSTFAQQAAAAAPQPVTYPGDARVTLCYVQTEKAADFENLYTKLKESLAKTTDDTLKKLADGWAVYKSPAAAGEGVTLYIVINNPVVKGADYTLWKILMAGFPTDYRDIYNKYTESFRATAPKVTPLDLNLFISMK